MVAVAIAYLASSFLVGLLLVQRLFPDTPPLVRLAGGYLVGLLITAWATLLVALALSPLDDALLIAIFVVLAVQVMVLGRRWGLLSLASLRLSRWEAVFAGLALVFSFWLMYQRLSGDPPMVAGNTWGDFGLHVPLARLFSWGHNLPPQYPFFAGEPIRYHFGSDFIVGALERQHLPLTVAFNIPGALAMSSIIVFSFELGRLLFHRMAVGVIAALLLLANSSLAFIRYLDKYDNKVFEALSNLWSQDRYVAVAPYIDPEDTLYGQDIAIYWTLNTFVTRTGVIIGMAIGLFVAYVLIQRLRMGWPFGLYRSLALGAILGSSLWINAQIYVAVVIFAVGLFAVFRRWREAIPFMVGAGVMGLVQLIYLGGGGDAGGNVKFHLGYLVDPLTFRHFFTYWWLNLGVAIPSLALAAVLVNRDDKRLLLAIMGIFAFGNLVSLGRDIGGNNHVLFTTWMLLMNVFIAFALLRVWQLKFLGKVLVPVLLLFLFLSGIIDVMVIKNDPGFAVFGDKTLAVEWIDENTAKDAVFLTDPQSLYMAPTLAGRRLYLGFEPWTKIAGYDVDPRLANIDSIYGAHTKGEACRLLIKEKIDYVQVGPVERGANYSTNWQLFADEFDDAFFTESPGGPLTFYDVQSSCLTA